VSFLDAGSQEQLAVRFEIPAQLGDVVFPLIERFPHTRISFAPYISAKSQKFQALKRITDPNKEKALEA